MGHDNSQNDMKICPTDSNFKNKSPLLVRAVKVHTIELNDSGKICYKNIRLVYVVDYLRQTGR